jgi:hypothetical protein
VSRRNAATAREIAQAMRDEAKESGRRARLLARIAEILDPKPRKQIRFVPAAEAQRQLGTRRPPRRRPPSRRKAPSRGGAR